MKCPNCGTDLEYLISTNDRRKIFRCPRGGWHYFEHIDQNTGEIKLLALEATLEKLKRKRED